MDLVNYLVERGRLNEAQRDRVAVLLRERAESEVVLVTRLGMLPERDMALALAEFLAIPLACSTDYPTTAVCADRLTAEFLVRARILPLEDTPNGLRLAMADPTDAETIKAVRLASGKQVVPCVAVPSELAAAVEQLYGVNDAVATGASLGRPTAAREDLKRLTDFASNEPVIRYVDWLIARAAVARASDIHIEASIGRLTPRLRIDGVLRDIEPPPPGVAENIVSRLKVMARLNVAERRLPQDGRFQTVIEGREVDLRISIVPTLHGESVVLRLLDRAQAPLDLTALGLSHPLRASFARLLAQPNGMLLVTGPTGSGKTSTLYAALQLLNDRGRKILTIEDPVEYQLDGINQIPIRPEIGLDFPMLLRSVLRQDPDVLLVGEIRDADTARIAAQAALTGHLLLSTLHTIDAVSAVIRLIDMGLEDYLVAAVLKGVLAQRLVRRLCRACRQPHELDRKLVNQLQLADMNDAPCIFYRPGGCVECGGTGYRGRLAIAEMLVFDERLSRIVIAAPDAASLRAEARALGMIDLYTDGISMAAAGITSVDEVLRVTGSG